MTSPNTSSEVDLELEQFAENYILARNDNNLDSMQFWVKRAKNLLHQSEIKGRIDQVMLDSLSLSILLDDVDESLIIDWRNKQVESLNQMKGKL